MKPVVTLLTVVMVLFAAPSDKLKAGKNYSALVCLSLRKGPSVEAEKIDVIPLLDEVLFTGDRKGELETTLFGKSVTDSFVQVVHGRDTGWVFGAMIGESWNYMDEIRGYINRTIALDDSYEKARTLLAEKYWEEDSELLDEYECDHLWQYWFTHSESVIIGIRDGFVVKRIVPLSFGSRTPRSYDVDLETYLNSPDLEEVCTTTIDLGHYEAPDGCYLKGLNE